MKAVLQEQISFQNQDFRDLVSFSELTLDKVLIQMEERLGQTKMSLTNLTLENCFQNSRW